MNKTMANMVEENRIAMLWSGGLDSTVMTYFLASKDYHVKPYHLLIRGGGGKDFREKIAVEEIFADLEHKYTNVEKPLHVRHNIKTCDYRNRMMISFLKDEFKENVIALGSYTEGSRYPSDNDKTSLSLITNCKIITFDTYGIKNKSEIASLIPSLGLEEVIKKAWSCQLWFKNPCGKCYSCKQREQILNKFKK